jgi:A/G-specific adenine glycosylase
MTGFVPLVIPLACWRSRPGRWAAAYPPSMPRRPPRPADDVGAELISWYAQNGRDLPWRRTRDPYAILVSEVMLQQTQVARVVPRYEAWLERWPSAEALAAEPLGEVLRAWVGLGYNRRAVRLWEACRAVADRGWPEDLRELPGVGPYTAAAVGAFAFGRDELPVDVNVARVVERLGGRPDGEAAVLGQALMDLGATICTARAPRCEACPMTRCASRGAVAAPPRRPGPRERFEDTDRYARGRVVAAVAAGEPLPDGLGEERLERALAGLERDGLVIRDGGRAFFPHDGVVGSAPT